MKDRIFGVLQRVGRSFMLPIAILPAAGLLLGIGSSFTNETTIAMYGLERILGEGTILRALLMIMNKVGSAVFDNLPILFAVGIAIGMAKKEKEVAALSAVIAYFVMNTAINAMLILNGEILEEGSLAADVLEGSMTVSCGITTLQMGVFGGIIVGLGVAALHNRFYKMSLPNALSFFGGTHFVPIISTIVYMFVGILMYFVWPIVQNVIYALGSFVTDSKYVGTLIFGLAKRALIPFGLHHVFYMPFWQTAVGGTMEVAGQLVQGGQNIFFAQLADSANVTHFSADAARYFSGEFIFMIWGLPGAALAMYHCAKPEKKKETGGLLLSAALTCVLTGITEPLEFSFLFAAPMLFVTQVILAGTAYMVAHMLNIAVGLTFSGGLLDFFFFGILQGNEKTSWMLVIPVGVIYFILYYVVFRFMILKFDLKTPGRQDDAEKEKNLPNVTEEFFSEEITRGLGGKENISDVDCCATRLRCTVKNPELVSDEILKDTGAAGVIRKGQGVQIVYGPHVTVIKSNLEDYLGRLEKNTDKSVIIYSPIDGTAADISMTPDPSFAERLLGDGVVIMPTGSEVKAPEDGTVLLIFETKHAIGFETDSGVHMLIHIGIDTVKLNGKGFTVLAEKGQRVQKGETLIRLDLEYLKTHAPSTATPIICTELKKNQKIRLLKEGTVQAGDALFAIDTIERI